MCVPMMVLMVPRNAEFAFFRKDIVQIIKLLKKMNDRKNVNVAVV